MHRTASILARGDPGFFDFIKRVGGAALRATPIGAAFSTASAILRPRTAPAFPASRPQPSRRSLSGPASAVIIAAAPLVASAVESRIAQGGVQPVGTHLNKSSYFLRDGTFVPARSRYVRNRTRNNANGRALRRAIGRAKGFDNLVKRNRKALRSLSRI